MINRWELQQKLEDLLGSTNVYFQPPATITMKYPCIVYSRSDFTPWFANDQLYINHTKYSVKVIDKNPDSIIPSKVAQLPLCKFDRFYTIDNLNHDVYNLYYK